MELGKLNGSIIGVISDIDIKESIKEYVKDMIIKKPSQALKMVGLDDTYLDKEFTSLSLRNQNKVLLASKLQDKVIVLKDFSQGLLKKDIEFYKNLFKKIIKYNKKIILIDKDTNLFINCCDKIYEINEESIKEIDIYDTDASIVEFVNYSANLGIKINHYIEFDELLKAIYRIKS